MSYLSVRVFVGCNLSSDEIIDIRMKLAALAHLRTARVAKKRDHPTLARGVRPVMVTREDYV